MSLVFPINQLKLIQLQFLQIENINNLSQYSIWCCVPINHNLAIAETNKTEINYQSDTH